MSIRQLLYISTQSRDLNAADIDCIVKNSQKRNIRHDITGLLLYLEGSFCQVIEGHSKDVDIIYNHIAKDTSHRSLIVLQDDMTEERSFKDWSMAYQNITQEELEQKSVDEIRSYILNKFHLSKKSNNFIPVMLHSFIFNHTKMMNFKNVITPNSNYEH